MGGKINLNMVSRRVVLKTRKITRFGSNLTRWGGFLVDWWFGFGRDFFVVLV